MKSRRMRSAVMQSQLFILEKLQRRVQELSKYRYKHIEKLDNWQVIEDKSKMQKYPPKDWAHSESFKLGDSWKGRDFYLWVHQTITVPNVPNPLLFLDFGKTGGGYNSGFESLLFINGQPYQGVDSNHKEVFLSDDLVGQEIVLDLKLWSGLEGGGPEKILIHTFLEAFVGSLSDKTDDLFYYADALLKTIHVFSEDDPQRYELLDVLNRAFLLINWQNAGSQEFYDSIEAADTFLVESLAKIDKKSLIEITAVGQTHIDVAWLWRLKHTREKVARSFSTVLKLMEKYPEYIFMHTTPQVYKYIKEDYPELFQEIKKRVAEGRWEIDGAMWLEADCNIPSGESLTRQILFGKRFIKEEFDRDSHYLWLPDVFGYSWALPQILRKSDIDTFMTTKISWNQFNRMPHDTFYWRGIDGSDILTHFITTPEPSEGGYSGKDWSYTYNGRLEPSTVTGIYDAYQDKDINHDLLLAYGYGDGGGGVTRDMIEKRRRLDDIPGLPQVKTGRVDDYFRKLHQTVSKTDHYVQTWDGELYLEYHRGTYTSQAYVKKMNRQMELTLRELEMLYTSQHIVSGKDYPTDELTAIWEVVLRNQFHDIIPGSFIKEVYQDHREEMSSIVTSSQNLINNLEEETQEASSKEDTKQDELENASYQVINTSGWSRSPVTIIPGIEKGIAVDENGQSLPTVITDEGAYVKVDAIEALSTKAITFKDSPEKRELALTKSALTISEQNSNGLETPFYSIEWNDDYQFVSLFDKQNDREVLKGNGNVLQVFEDKPINFDCWDIELYYQEKMTIIPWETLKVIANNALYADLELTATINQSTIKQTVRVYANDRRIDFITHVDWKERQQLLKVSFEVAIRATEATYDIQYGNVKRPTHWNTSWDLAKFETVGHQWADLSQRDYGVSLLNDSKYGYDIKENRLRLSLLKGGIYPDPTADIGQHDFTYSLLPHKGDFVEGKTVEEALEINRPLTVLKKNNPIDIPLKIVAGEPLAIDAFKLAEDQNGWIVRFHEHTGARKKVEIELPNGFGWLETNMVERDLTEEKSSPVIVELTPYEIKTIRINKIVK